MITGLTMYDYLKAVTFEEAIFKRADGLLLPMDMISRVCRLLQDFEVNVQSSLDCLALVFGLFPDPKQGTIPIVLTWSPFRQLDLTANTPEGTMQDLLNHAISIVRDRFSVAFTRFHETAMVCMKKDFPVPCHNFLWRGTRKEIPKAREKVAS